MVANYFIFPGNYKPNASLGTVGGDLFWNDEDGRPFGWKTFLIEYPDLILVITV